MADETVRITVDGEAVEGRTGETLLSVCRRLGKEIPTLCHHEAFKPYASCRVCLVEVVSGARPGLVPSCQYPVSEGLVVQTESAAVRDGRRVVLELLLARCPKSDKVKEVAAKYGVTSTPYPTDDPDETCILCGLCVRACEEAIRASAIGFAGRGVDRHVTSPFDLPSEICIGCEACINVCPTGHVVKRLEEGKLVMETWHTEMPRHQCARCGEMFLTQRQLEFLREHSEKALPEEIELCPDCRRKTTGEKVKSATKAAGSIEKVQVP